MLRFRSNEYQLNNNDEKLDKPSECFQAYKNLLVLSFVFLLQFTAINGIGNLQSSLNFEANIGVNSLSIIYAFLIISSIFLPAPMIAIAGLKWTIVIAQIPYILYVAANYYPKAYLMYTAGALLGLSAAPLWISKCSYLTEVARSFAIERDISANVMLNRFFGIFFMFFQSSQIWGSLISYLVLKPKEILINETISTNATMNYDKCGADYLDQEYHGTQINNNIDRQTVDLLCIIYVWLCLLSMFAVIFFLDQRPNQSKDEDNFFLVVKKSVHLLTSTIKSLKNLDQILLIPLIIWSGAEQSFIGAHFTKGFVSCMLNAKYIGLVFISYGVCDSIACLCFGQLVKYVGRWPCFLIATLINYSLMFVMLFWRTNGNPLYMLMILAGLWGISDGVWQTQINALYGDLFVENREAAFSNHRCWQSIGFVIFFVMTPYVRIRNSLIILIVLLTLSMIGYISTEYRLRKRQTKT